MASATIREFYSCLIQWIKFLIASFKFQSQWGSGHYHIMQAVNHVSCCNHKAQIKQLETLEGRGREETRRRHFAQCDISLSLSLSLSKPLGPLRRGAKKNTNPWRCSYPAGTNLTLQLSICSCSTTEYMFLKLHKKAVVY